MGKTDVTLFFSQHFVNFTSKVIGLPPQVLQWLINKFAPVPPK